MRVKLDFYTIAFVVILILAALTRFAVFDHPLAAGGGDGSRDYLVAQHIVKYGEFPLTGPWNGVLAGVNNSPIYYYFLAIFLVIYDNILFLAIINIVLQLLTIVFIYLIAKDSFGSPQALIAMLLFSFTALVIAHSEYLWQPHVMQPFVNLGFLLLLWAYRAGSTRLILWGLLTMVFASVLHNSVFAVMPLYLILAFMILRKYKKPIIDYIKSIAAVMVPIIIFYIPLVVYFIINKVDLIRIFSDNFKLLENLSSTTFIYRVDRVFTDFFQGFNLRLELFSLANIPVVTLISLSILIYLFRSKINKNSFLVGIGALFIISQIFFASFIPNVSGYHHYLIPILGIFCILIAEVIYGAWGKRTRLVVIVPVILFLIYTFSLNFKFVDQIKSIGQPLNNVKIVNSATKAIIDKAYIIKREHEYKDIDFFHITSFRTGSFGVSELVLLAAIENRLDRKFTEIDDTYTNSLRPINISDYIFLSCHDYKYKYDRALCQDEFYSVYPTFTIVEEIYSEDSITVYITKRK